MGDRSSIYITSKSTTGYLHLYGHWSGEDNARAVATVLRDTDRVGDPYYLTAQVFYEFSVIEGGYTGSLGFGIGSVNVITDNTDDNDLILLNADTGEVEYRGERYTKAEFVNGINDLLNKEVGINKW